MPSQFWDKGAAEETKVDQRETTPGAKEELQETVYSSESSEEYAEIRELSRENSMKIE